jgi:hypothetical protein
MDSAKTAVPRLDARDELIQLRRTLVDLAEWAIGRLNDDYDRQYIAEHMTDSLIAVIARRDLPRPPF